MARQKNCGSPVRSAGSEHQTSPRPHTRPDPAPAEMRLTLLTAASASSLHQQILLKSLQTSSRVKNLSSQNPRRIKTILLCLFYWQREWLNESPRSLQWDLPSSCSCPNHQLLFLKAKTAQAHEAPQDLPVQHIWEYKEAKRTGGRKKYQLFEALGNLV